MIIIKRQFAANWLNNIIITIMKLNIIQEYIKKKKKV